ncbi:MAG: VacJ family lipoprotein, partial [bacterium]|nr:VacJ family lipoprotein [bacterium]
ATAPAPATLAGQEARWRAESAITSAVVGSIMRHPGQHREIVSYATARAPALRDVIVAKSVDSFPGFADSIRQSANLTAAPPPPTAEAPADDDTVVAGLPEEVSDPIEGVNRAVFWVNDLIDTWIFRPIAWTYGFIMPDFIKEGVRNGFDNFNSPVILANDLLQFELEDAAITTGRLVINSTIGIVGLFDVASEWGLPPHHADFGQTMHSYGIGAGPY